MVYENVLDIEHQAITLSQPQNYKTHLLLLKNSNRFSRNSKDSNDAVTTDKINLVSTSSTPSLEAKGTSGQTDGYIQLNCEQNCMA